MTKIKRRIRCEGDLDDLVKDFPYYLNDEGPRVILFVPCTMWRGYLLTRIGEEFPGHTDDYYTMANRFVIKTRVFNHRDPLSNAELRLSRADLLYALRYNTLNDEDIFGDLDEEE